MMARGCSSMTLGTDPFGPRFTPSLRGTAALPIYSPTKAHYGISISVSRSVVMTSKTRLIM